MGDHSSVSHSYLNPYSVSMSAVLTFALSGHLMQMPAAIHLIPRTLELILPGMLH